MTAFFESILNGIFSVVHNYGWTIVLFTVLVRVLLLPLDYRSRKGMRKMTAISAQTAVLQKKYANDRDKLNRKMSELYKKEGVSPLSGCVPMLLQWPILFIMFAAMRAMTNEQMVKQVFAYILNPNVLPQMDSWLWIKNIWVADSVFASIAPDLNSLRVVDYNIWKDMFNLLSETDQAALISAVQAVGGTIDFTTKELGQASAGYLIQVLQGTAAYQNALTPISSTWQNVNVLFFNFTIYQQYNGLLILPALAAITQLLMNKLNPAQAGQTEPQQQNAQGQSTAKFMQVFFPLLSVYFCLISNAGFAIYWVTSNVVMGATTIIINKILDKRDNAPKKSDVSAEGSVR